MVKIKFQSKSKLSSMCAQSVTDALNKLIAEYGDYINMEFLDV